MDEKKIRDLGKKGEAFVRESYNKVAIIMAKGFRLEKKEFPSIKIVDGFGRAYDHVNNYIIIGTDEPLSDVSEIISEELGHYIKAKLRGQVGSDYQSAGHSGEFIGFLSGVMVYDNMTPAERKKFFPQGRPNVLKHYAIQKKREIAKEIAAVIVISTFIGLVLLFSGKLTGYLVVEPELTTAYGTILIAIMVIGGLVWWLIRKKYFKSC